MKKEFFASDAGQCAAIAKSFLEGAVVLDAAQRDNGRLLFRPTLALAAHGLELMLKSCFYLNDQKPPTKGRKRHDIVHLWQHDASEPLRGSVYVNALLVTAQARERDDYPDLPHDDDIVPLIDEYVIALGKLHGGDGYPLRYPSDPRVKAPRTPLLVKSLWGAADDLVKRPSDFKLPRFHALNEPSLRD